MYVRGTFGLRSPYDLLTASLVGNVAVRLASCAELCDNCETMYQTKLPSMKLIASWTVATAPDNETLKNVLALLDDRIARPRATSLDGVHTTDLARLVALWRGAKQHVEAIVAARPAYEQSLRDDIIARRGAPQCPCGQDWEACFYHRA